MELGRVKMRGRVAFSFCVVFHLTTNFGFTAVLGECLARTRAHSSNISEDGNSYKYTVFNAQDVAGCGCVGEYTCVRKCCDEDYILDLDEGLCQYNKSVVLSVPIYKFGNLIIDDDYMVEYRYISGINKCYVDDDDDYYYTAGINEFFIQNDGRLWMSNLNTYFSHDQYCLEYDEDAGPLAILCNIDYNYQALEISERLTVIGMLISLPFLFVTFVVYAVLPLRNLHGKSLMCYVFCLFTTYLMGAIIHLHPNPENMDAISCKALAMSFYYFFEASFFWINVMSIDIFLTFSGARGFSTNKRRTERRRFILYSAYAWSTPMLLVAVVLTLSRFIKPNRWYNPGMSDQQCWLNDGIPLFIFFYLPMTLIIITNIILFGITAYKIRQVQQDTAVLRKGDNKTSRDDDERIRFSVYVKLFLAMGINWSMEIIAWAVDWHFEHIPPAVWYVTEFCNAAFGVFIFFIFVFKKNVWNLMKKRYNQCRGITTAESETTRQSST